MSTSNTSVSQAQQDARLSLGYEWENSLRTHVQRPMRPVDNIGPAGAINSNVLEMAQWLRFQLGHGVYDGSRLLSEAQHREAWESQIEILPGIDYGFGWVLRDWQGRPLIEHGGNVDGFASQVALLPESNLGFVLLTNVLVSSLQQESISMVWEALLGDLDIGEGDIDYGPYLGKYMTKFGPLQDREYTILTRDARLALNTGGETIYDLNPPDEGGKWYFAITDEVAVSFDRDDEGSVIAITIYESGLGFEIPRVGVEIPVEIPLDELQKFVGTYHSEDLGTDVKVVVQNNRLAVDVPGQLVFELHPPDQEAKWVFRAKAEIAVMFTESALGVDSMTMYQGGKEFRMARVDGEPLPSVADILVLRDTVRRVVAQEEMGTYLMTGTVWLPQSGVEGTFSTYVSGTDRIRSDADFGMFGSARWAVYGDRAWMESFGRFDVLHGQLLAQAIRAHPAAFDDWLDFYDSIRVLNASELDGRKIYVVKLERDELPATTVYVDAESGDILKSEGTVLAAAGIGIPVVTRFEDYREVHGVRIAFRRVSSNEASGREVTQIDSIETNIDVSTEIFQLDPPSGD